ncbi:acid-sensing ion channel 4-A-like [Babylonia areolata]|uniref:acid-sensing ion channel 4-A-like n=1 Tax=Babylonia areolata TaxID=304850 RepID=UPI003FD648D2
MQRPRENRYLPEMLSLDERAFRYLGPRTMTSDGRVFYRPGSSADMIYLPTRHGYGKEDSDKRGEEDEDKGSKPGFGEYLISTTGLQGPGKMWEAPYRPLKVLWMLAFLTACAVMVFQLYELFDEFLSFPTKTVVKLKFSPLPLPALTLCNVNPIRKSFARNLSCSLQNLLNIPDLDRSEDCNGTDLNFDYLDFSNSHCDDCDYDGTMEDMDSFAARRETISVFLGDEARDMRTHVGHQLEDMIVNCSLFGRACPFRNVTAFQSRDYGNCYTLSAPKIKATKSGPEAALVLTLNLETEEFIDGYKTGYGMRVVLHEHGTRPFPSTEGFTVSSAAETEIAVRMTQIKRKGGKYGQCEEGGVVKALSGYKYTIKNCRENCLYKTVLEKCKCVALENEDFGAGLTSVASSVKVCSSEKEFECYYRAYDRYINASLKSGGDSCNCQTPCEEKVFSTTLSARAWPTLNYIPVLEEQVCKLDHTSPKCSYLHQPIVLENLDVRRGFARIRLFYDRLNYEYVEELPFYDIERFLSDIGGTLGLWIGVTALGLVELFELVLFAVFKCRTALMSKRSRR